MVREKCHPYDFNLEKKRKEFTNFITHLDMSWRIIQENNFYEIITIQY